MQRRNAITTAGLAGIAALTTSHTYADDSNKRFGDVVIPKEQEMGKEKHVPIIDTPLRVKSGEPFIVTVEVGKTVPHPNTVEHHIKWIQLYTLEEGSRYVVNMGTFEFGPTYAVPKVSLPVILRKNATLYALGHCNIHGLWDYSVDVKVE